MAVPEESEKHDAKRHDRVAVDEESNIEQQSVIPIIDNEPKKADRLHGFKLMALLFALMVGTFMVILDWPIITPVIPKITTEFKSLSDIAWYGSAYLLAQLSWQPTAGKLFTLLNVKWSYLATLVLFLIGSIICATARNSPTFIVGRAVAGMGSSGLYVGTQTILVHSTTLRKRALAMSLLQCTAWAAALVSVPLGGVFADSVKLTWRFCFWINLPLGGITAIIILLKYKPPPAARPKTTLIVTLASFDFLGTLLLVPSLLMLLLALQWGGITYLWNNPKVWGCLLAFVLVMAIVVASQVFNQARATIQRRLMSNRTLIACYMFQFFLYMSFTVQQYYLPIYFQAVKGASPSAAGVDLLPYKGTTTTLTLIAGISISELGDYALILYSGAGIFMAGSWALYTFKPNTIASQWICLQLVAGVGFGMNNQIAYIAVQNVVPSVDAPMCISLLIFSLGLGGSVGLGIAQNLFFAALRRQLGNISGVSVDAIIAAGASANGLERAVPAAILPLVRQAYSDALSRVWIFAGAAATVAFFCSLAVEMKRIKRG